MSMAYAQNGVPVLHHRVPARDLAAMTSATRVEAIACHALPDHHANRPQLVPEVATAVRPVAV